MRERMIQRQIRIFNIVLIVMILSMMVFFLYAKEGLHPDEIMTYESANASGSVGLLYERLSEDDNTWITKQEVYDCVTVGDEDYWNYTTAMRYSYSDFNPPLYRIILHIASSATPGVFSKWTGGILNLIYLFGILFLIVRMCSKVLNHPKIAPYCLAIYGFSVGTITGVLIVKPYMAVAFSLLWILYEHGLFWNQSENKSPVRLALSVIFGMWTQFYLNAFLLVLVFLYVVFLMRMRRKREIKNYLLTLGVAVLIGVAGISVVDFVFNKENTVAMALWNKLASIDWTITPFELMRIYLENTFGNVYIGMALLVFFIGVGLACLISRKLKWRHGMLYFPSMMLLPTAIYLLFPTEVAVCYSDRYLVSTFPILLILMVWGIDKMLHLLPIKDINRQWIMSVALCILIMPGIVFYDFEYLMPGDKEKEEIARTYEDFPCVFVGEDVYADLQEMLYFSETLALKPEQVRKADKERKLQNNSDVVLLLTGDLSDLETIDFFKRNYDYENVDVLMEAADGTRYYLLSK